jgi:phenylpropionate dioxygenase-like ring-hydroxylating dioxygenase large terminal subunit
VAEKVIPDVATEGAQFNWEEQWYPIAVEAFTDKRKPNKFMLLGNDVVLWHDKKNGAYLMTHVRTAEFL